MAEGTTVTVPELRKAFAEELAQWSQSNKPPAPAVQPETAKMEQEAGGTGQVEVRQMGLGILRGPIEAMDGFKLPLLNVSLPIGSAVAGGFVGLATTQVVDVLVAPRQADDPTRVNLLNPIVQVGGAVALLKFGPGIMGGTASKFAAGTIVLSMVMRHVPLFTEWLTKLVETVTPAKPVVESQGGWGQAPGAPSASSVYQQAQDVVASYDKSAGYA